MSRRRRRVDAAVEDARLATEEMQRLLTELEGEVRHLQAALLGAMGGRDA